MNMRFVSIVVILVANLCGGMAHAKNVTQPVSQTNWFEQIVQTLTGTQQPQTITSQPMEKTKVNINGIKTQHRHTIHKKHRHSHHAHTSIQRASAKDMKSRAHTKLFEEFQEWHNKQQLYQLFNPIQHGSP